MATSPPDGKAIRRSLEVPMDTNLRGFLFWTLVCVLVLILIVILFTSNRASAELCLNRIDNSIEKRSGFRWQYRDVDGRRCWFYSNSLLPKEDLIWSYKSEEFDDDVKVIERKFYGFDENNLLLERRREAK
jgi:hypothetical protein